MRRDRKMREQRRPVDTRYAEVASTREIERRWRAACEGSGFCQWIYTPTGWNAAVARVEKITLGNPISIMVELRLGQIPEDISDRARRLSYAMGCADLRVTPAGLMLVRVDLLDPEDPSGSVDFSPAPERTGPSEAWTARRHPEQRM